MDYKEIIDGLETKSVIELMQKLGADRYIERPGYVIFPTICHNVDSAEASMKLYYYTNNKELAIHYIDKAIELDPTDDRLLVNKKLME